MPDRITVLNKALVAKAMETSKVIVLATGAIYIVHLYLSAYLILIGHGASAISLMGTTMPIYLGALAGYFGKAWSENVTKIKLLSEELQTRPVQATTTHTGSNG